VMYLLDPTPRRLSRIAKDEAQFEAALVTVRRIAVSAEEQDLLGVVETTYQKYKKDQDQIIASVHGQPPPEVHRIADEHPVSFVVAPCQKLLQINKDRMNATKDESQRVSHEGYVAMIFMGLAGPIGGLVVGYGVTRGLRRSIYQLSVRVHDL